MTHLLGICNDLLSRYCIYLTNSGFQFDKITQWYSIKQKQIILRMKPLKVFVKLN